MARHASGTPLEASLPFEGRAQAQAVSVSRRGSGAVYGRRVCQRAVPGVSGARGKVLPQDQGRGVYRGQTQPWGWCSHYRRGGVTVGGQGGSKAFMTPPGEHNEYAVGLKIELDRAYDDLDTAIADLDRTKAEVDELMGELAVHRADAEDLDRTRHKVKMLRVCLDDGPRRAEGHEGGRGGEGGTREDKGRHW